MPNETSIFFIKKSRTQVHLMSLVGTGQEIERPRVRRDSTAHAAQPKI